LLVDTKNILSNNIKKIRNDKGMSQTELAELCNVSQAYISYLEDGKKNNPTSGVLTKIAESLGVTINDLFIASDASPES
jgi:transcriptional regulator with XRE-family HTH domain